MPTSAASAPWLLHILCGSVYLAMAVLVVARRPRETLNRICGVLILCFALWCATLAVCHYPHVSKPTARLFYNLGSFAWGSFASLAVLFLAAFWRPSLLRSKAFVAALVLPALVIIHAQWTGRLAADYVQRPWGYAFVWQNSLQANFFTGYYSLYMLVSLGLLLVGARREKAPVRRRQARIIVTSALLPLAMGSLTDVWLPRAGIHIVPNMAPDFTLIWVLGLVYAIVRYRMLELSPRVAADRVVETMSDALFLVDAQGRIAWPNPAASRLFGQSLDDLRRMTLTDLMGRSLPFGEPRQDPGRRDVTVKHKDGTELVVNLSMSEIRGGLGELVGWVCLATDITSRKRVETELRQARDALESRVAERTRELQQANGLLRSEITERKRSEDGYRLLIESMHEGLWVLDGEDRTTLVNSRLGHILGLEPGEIVGRFISDFADERSVVACNEALQRAHAGVAGQGDWHLRHKDGRRLSTIVQVSPLRSEGGGYRGCVLTVMDVTEREGMQAQLARAERLASLGLLAAGVGHEINNPLTYVILNLEEIAAVTARRAADPALADLAGLSAEALEGARRVQEIVKDLRRFSRSEPRPVAAIDVHDALEDAIRLGRNEVRFRARLVRQFGAELPRVMANLGSLSQVFLNLIVNAAHAIDEGQASRNEIRIRTWSSGNEVMVELADTGKGIAAEDVGRIFDPFFSTKEVSDGLGLGLAICHETIASLGGRILVDSRVGQGSRFLVALKIAAPAGAAAATAEVAAAPQTATATPPSPAPAPASVHAPSLDTATATATTANAAAPAEDRARILVVDDEDLVRRTMERLLAKHFRVVTATSGVHARQLIEEDATGFDLVFCDLMMPEMSGMALADWVAARVPELSARLVFMTGGVFTVQGQRFLANAPNPTLEKPFRPEEVIDLARQTLKKRRKPGP
jgi:PAS domain S-box-containing protein